MSRTLRSFAQDRKGATTVEFVVVFLGFMAVMFFVVEVALYMFFMASLEKAAQAAVRTAVVSPPVASIPLTNERAAGGIFGRACSLGGQCNSFATATCRGESPRAGEVLCEPIQFTRIFNHLRGFNAGIQKANVTVTYQYVGIGFAGGPTVPMVTVAIAEVPYQTGIFSLLLGPAGSGVLGELPSRSASMTGEFLGP